MTREETWQRFVRGNAALASGGDVRVPAVQLRRFFDATWDAAVRAETERRCGGGDGDPEVVKFIKDMGVGRYPK